MNKKTLHSWFSMPEVSYGTLSLGGRKDAEPSIFDHGVAAVKHVLSKGIRSFDTAELYWCGEAEKILWAAIEGIPREELFIASKVRGSNASYTAIKKACENSLKRVGVDYFNLYYIHWRESQFDLAESMRAMEELVDEGKIKYIWVSNFSKESLAEAQSYCKKYKIVANQVHYNLLFRECESTGLLDYCKQNDVMLVAYRPYELGKICNGTKLVAYEKQFQKTASQIALAWLYSQKNVVALFQSDYNPHIDEDIAELDWKLSSEVIEELRVDYPAQIFVSDCIALG